VVFRAALVLTFAGFSWLSALSQECYTTAWNGTRVPGHINTDPKIPTAGCIPNYKVPFPNGGDVPTSPVAPQPPPETVYTAPNPQPAAPQPPPPSEVVNGVNNLLSDDSPPSDTNPPPASNDVVSGVNNLLSDDSLPSVSSVVSDVNSLLSVPAVTDPSAPQLLPADPNAPPINGADQTGPTPDEKAAQLLGVPMIQSYKTLWDVTYGLPTTAGEYLLDKGQEFVQGFVVGQAETAVDMVSSSCLLPKNMLYCSTATPNPTPGPTPSSSPSAPGK
jgi:hypothetical protein